MQEEDQTIAGLLGRAVRWAACVGLLLAGAKARNGYRETLSFAYEGARGHAVPAAIFEGMAGAAAGVTLGGFWSLAWDIGWKKIGRRIFRRG